MSEFIGFWPQGVGVRFGLSVWDKVRALWFWPGVCAEVLSCHEVVLGSGLRFRFRVSDSRI